MDADYCSLLSLFYFFPLAVNQIELHPWCQQKPIVEYCTKRNIVVQAYCPLVRAERNSDATLVSRLHVRQTNRWYIILRRNIQVGIAKEVNKTPAQVLIRWSLQRGFVPLPKSDTPSRISTCLPQSAPSFEIIRYIR